MLIRIASILFNIDDNLLCPKTTQYLAPCVVAKEFLPEAASFRVSLCSAAEFSGDIAPETRLKKVHYQESGTIITAADHFSAFRINVDKRSMEICPSGDRYLQELDFISDLKLLLSIIILEKGGVLLHSSAVCRNGSALVFTGQSGSGKSTIAKLLSPSWDIVNDEFNVLIPENGKVLIYPTPFGTIKSFQEGAQVVRNIFLLKKSIVNKIEEIKERSEMMCLIKNVCTFPSNDYYGNKLLENVHLLKSVVPLKRLLFIKNGSISDFIESIGL